MARKPSPWWWENEQGWYVNHQGKRRFLGKHPEGAARPRKSPKTAQWNAPKEISDAFHALMRGDETETPAPSIDSDSVAAVLDDFIAWCYENRERRTADRYKDFIQEFVSRCGRLPVSAVSARDVTEWLNERPTWNGSTKRNAITAVSRGFNWAVKNRNLARNPVKGIEKPAAEHRTAVVNEAQFRDMLDVCEGCFRDLIIVSYDCGARPQEVKRLEAKHIDAANRMAKFTTGESKGKRKARVIYVPTERSMEIVRRLCSERPSGPIFRNSRGNPWTGDAVKNRFEDLQVALGLLEMERKGVESAVTEEAIEERMKRLKQTKTSRSTGKPVKKLRWELRKEARAKLIAEEAKAHAPRFCQYDMRRTFITRKIIAGVDSHVVARLSGHASTEMIDRHYSAVADDHEFMLKEAMREITPSSDH